MGWEAAIPIIGGLFKKKPKTPQPPAWMTGLGSSLSNLWGQYGPRTLASLYNRTTAGGANPTTSAPFLAQNQYLTDQADQDVSRNLGDITRRLQQRGVLSPGTYAGAASALGQNEGSDLARARQGLLQNAYARQDTLDNQMLGAVSALPGMASSIGSAAYGNQVQNYGLQQQDSEQLGSFLGALAYVLQQMGSKGGGQQGAPGTYSVPSSYWDMSQGPLTPLPWVR